MNLVKKLMAEKIVGYVLLTLGVLIILLAGINVFGIFTKAVTPVDIFNFSGISTNIAIAGMGQQEIELIQGDILNQTTNLIAHVILMGFLASIGYRLAAIGVLILRPIVVKLNSPGKGV